MCGTVNRLMSYRIFLILLFENKNYMTHIMIETSKSVEVSYKISYFKDFIMSQLLLILQILSPLHKEAIKYHLSMLTVLSQSKGRGKRQELSPLHQEK